MAVELYSPDTRHPMNPSSYIYTFIHTHQHSENVCVTLCNLCVFKILGNIRRHQRNLDVFIPRLRRPQLYFTQSTAARVLAKTETGTHYIPEIAVRPSPELITINLRPYLLSFFYPNFFYLFLIFISSFNYLFISVVLRPMYFKKLSLSWRQPACC